MLIIWFASLTTLFITILVDPNYLPYNLNLTEIAVPSFGLDSQEFITQCYDYVLMFLTLLLFLVLYVLAFLLKSKLVADKPIDSDLLYLFWSLVPVVIFIFLSVPSLFLISFLSTQRLLSLNMSSLPLWILMMWVVLEKTTEEMGAVPPKLKSSHGMCTVIDTKKLVTNTCKVNMSSNKVTNTCKVNMSSNKVTDTCGVDTGSDKVAVSIKKVIITNTGDAIANAWVLGADPA